MHFRNRLDSCAEARAGPNFVSPAIGGVCIAYVNVACSAEQKERMCFVTLQAVSASNNAI